MLQSSSYDPKLNIYRQQGFKHIFPFMRSDKSGPWGFQAWILPGYWFSLAFDHLALGILVGFFLTP